MDDGGEKWTPGKKTVAAQNKGLETEEKERKEEKKKVKDSGEGHPMTELIPKADDVLYIYKCAILISKEAEILFVTKFLKILIMF